MQIFLRLMAVVALLHWNLVWTGTLRKGLRRRKLLPRDHFDVSNGTLNGNVGSVFHAESSSSSSFPPELRSSVPVVESQPLPQRQPQPQQHQDVHVPGPNKRIKVRRKKGHPEGQRHFPGKRIKRPFGFAAGPAALSTGQTYSAANRTFDEQRFLSLFTIVSFKNDACSSGSGSNGTCYSSSDCSRLGGTSSGSCASGFGVCCLFTSTCGQTTSNNCTYFQNSGYPSTFNSVGSCQLTVNKANDNVCQLRLDFNNFVIAGPDTVEQVCTTDQLIITGGSPIPAICGVNSGQHVYVDTGLTSNNPITLTLVTSGTSFSRSFSVRVCQIECTSLSRASDGCMQYFTGVTGQAQTFNYNSGSGLQLSNTDYTICFRMERNFCGIQYSVCPDTVNTPAMSFSVTGSATIAVGALIGPNCATDWITIPCATNLMNPTAQSGTPAVCVDRICGMVFNSVTALSTTSPTSVFSYAKPFTLHVHTNSVEGSSTPTETKNRGFCLNYTQLPCTTSSG